MRYCTNCGRQLPPRARFCMHCGKPCTGAERAPKAPQAEAAGKARGGWGKFFAGTAVGLFLARLFGHAPTATASAHTDPTSREGEGGYPYDEPAEHAPSLDGIQDEIWEDDDLYAAAGENEDTDGDTDEGAFADATDEAAWDEEDDYDEEDF